MAEDAAKTAAPQGGLAASAAALKTLAASLETVTTTSGVATKTDPPAVQSGLSEGAARAVERYRQTIRWMLGAFAAVALVVFGSVPFTDLGKATDAQELLIVRGLIAVAIGVALAIYAVSIVAEPEDASLGELSGDESRRAKQKQRWKTLYRFRSSWVFPRTCARDQMLDALEKEPGDVGPPWPPAPDAAAVQASPSRLIQDIASAQTARYVHAADTASAQATAEASKARLAAARETLATRWAWPASTAWGPALKGTDLDSLPTKLKWWTTVSFDDSVKAESTALQDFETDLAASRTASAALATTDARLAVHLQHRDIILDESGVTQLRGSFRLARRLLVLGAFATGLGAVAYASQLPPGPQTSEATSTTASTTPSRSIDFSASTKTSGSELPVEITRIRGTLPPAVVGCGSKALVGTTTGTFKPGGEAASHVVVVEPVECSGTWTFPPGTATVVARSQQDKAS